ncbi:MAG TPA: YdcF family protein [Bryobacteraceae bacterium]|nr:YdcF family protein [Bryobacteraceae bacterium]
MGIGMNPMRRRWGLGVAGALIVVLLAGSAAWCHWVYAQIESYANQDQAAPSDAICVFGAAEYDGRPSPVFRARLDHALELYRLGMAPLIITLGGPGGDQYTEGSVGAEYLESRGVPEQDIIAETASRNTEESARRVAVIAHANGLRRLIIVSDGTHLFRIHAICAAEGLDVLTSPRSRPAVDDPTLEAERLAHEIISYTAWRLHLH